MKVFGLTGGAGMGKSTSARFLHEHHIAVVDTDDIAHKLVEPGQPALAEIKRVFGGKVIGADGQLLRAELGRIVFSDTTARKGLEAILHPRIFKSWQERVGAWRMEGRKQAVVVIPLLFETNAEAEFDGVVCVACTRASQLQRLQARGWTLEQIDQRNAAQLPIEEKMARAGHVIWTEGTMDVHARQLLRIIPGI